MEKDSYFGAKFKICSCAYISTEVNNLISSPN